MTGASQTTSSFLCGTGTAILVPGDTRGRNRRWADYFKFWGMAVRQAWQIAWTVVIDKSARALIRDLIILVISIYSLLQMRGYLENIHALPQHDNLVAETLIWIALVAAATVILFAATFVFCAIFIAPFRLYQEQAKKLAALSQVAHEKSEKRAPQIEICSKSGAPYEVSDVSHDRVLSTVRIGIKNNGGSPLSNCKVYIEKMSPTPNLVGGLPILLEGSGFILRHDDPEKLIDIADHWNHVDRYRFHAPHGWFAETLNYLDDKIDRTIVIKVLAFECQRSASFKIWTDASRALHLDYIGYVD